LSSVPGHFLARIRFRTLKTNTTDPEFAHLNKTLLFKLLCPQKVSNLPFSIHHRILAIALRRKALIAIDSIAEHFNGTQQMLRFKDSFLDLPVLLSGSRSGKDIIDYQTAMKPQDLTTYLQRRAQKAGFPDREHEHISAQIRKLAHLLGVTFYSLRRRFASDLASIFGNDAARELMGHDPRSSTLERCYLKFAYLKNVVAAGLGEETQGQQDVLTADAHPQLLNRLTDPQMAQLQNQAVNHLLDEVLLAYVEFGKLDLLSDVGAYRQRTRTRLTIELKEELTSRAKEAMTAETMKARKIELFSEASEFSEAILARGRGASVPTSSRQATTSAAEGTSLPDNTVEGLSQTEDEPQDGDYDVNYEPDMEDLFNGDNPDVEVNPDVEDGDNITDSDSSMYLEMAREFIDIILSNSLSEYTSHERIKCPLCREDDTVPQDKKERERDVYAQRLHAKSQYHVGFEHFKRAVNLAKDESGEVRCPYCAHVLEELGAEHNGDADPELTFGQENMHPAVDYVDKSFHPLMRHVQRSGPNSIHGAGQWKLRAEAIERHDRLKALEGWYESAFFGEEEDATAAVTAASSRSSRAGVKWAKNPELGMGVSMAGRPDIVRGGPSIAEGAIPDRFDNLLTTEEKEIDMPPRFAGSLTTAEPFDRTDYIQEWETGELTHNRHSRG
jgi:hypothetical protein